MSANNLLLWMSARLGGSWQQFRAAVEELHLDNGEAADFDDEAVDATALPLYQVLRLNLQRFGHVEFFSGAGDYQWQVTPPCLAVTQTVHGWKGVLVGARSQKLMQRIHAYIGQALLETCVFPGCPDQLIFSSSDSGELSAVAERVGIRLQMDAPAALLCSTPAIDDPNIRRVSPIPFGADWKIHRFFSEELRWRSSSSAEATSASYGLFRFALRHREELLLCVNGSAFQMPGQVGKYLVLRRRRRQVLTYVVADRTLSVPAVCRPPFLIERALLLCSGSQPSQSRKNNRIILSYADIPENIAASTATLLRQELI